MSWGEAELKEGRRCDEVVEKPIKRNRVARFGAVVFERTGVVFGPDREGRKLSYSMDSSSDEMLIKMSKNDNKNR